VQADEVDIKLFYVI